MGITGIETRKLCDTLTARAGDQRHNLLLSYGPDVIHWALIAGLAICIAKRAGNAHIGVIAALVIAVTIVALFPSIPLLRFNPSPRNLIQQPAFEWALLTQGNPSQWKGIACLWIAPIVLSYLAVPTWSRFIDGKPRRVMIGVSFLVILVAVSLLSRPTYSTLKGIGPAFPVGAAPRSVPLLGMTLIQADPSAGEQGVMVYHCEELGPAATSGLQEGDMIVVVDGIVVHSPRQFVRATQPYCRDPAPRVSVEVLRDGERQTLQLELAGFDSLMKRSEDSNRHGSFPDP